MFKFVCAMEAIWILWIFSTIGICIHASHAACTEGITLECRGVVNCTEIEEKILNSSSSIVEDDWVRCVDQGARECILRREHICYGEVTCEGLPELPCDMGCNEFYRCQRSKGCVERSTVCNGRMCDGCPEDHEWHNGPGFKCLRNGEKCILPQQLLYDEIEDCDAGADVCFNKDNRTLDRSKCFQCLDGLMLIPSFRVCDGIIDCADLSDECLCEEKVPDVCQRVVTYEKVSSGNESMQRCSFGQVNCGNGECIERSSICDGKRDCDNDENFSMCEGTLRCEDADSYEKICRCTPHKRGCFNFYGTACNGIGDCPIPTASDMQPVSANTFPQDECVASCPYRNFTCVDESQFVGIPLGFIQCILEDGLSLIMETSWTEVCDGFLHCLPNGEDEKYCDSTRFSCKSRNLVNIEKDKVCDGTVDCDAGEDEAKELCGDEKFYCPALGGKKVNVPVSVVCDFNINCDNGEDEMNCTDGRFYCENGDPLFVRQRQTFDGRGDCSDWSDECPINQPADTGGFSSRYELISNPILRALVWIMGLLALFGNMVVICKETLQLKKARRMSAAVKANRVLILNLAFSDIFMGIFLIGLAIAGVSMQGAYCSRDLDWRSGNTCVTLGILSVISSETSVITMVLLTGTRLYAVRHPFKSSSRPRIRHVLLAIVLAWAISLTIALVPLAPSVSNVFVEKVKFSDNPFSRNVQISLKNATTLFKRMMTYGFRNNTPMDVDIDDFLGSVTWNDLREANEEYFGQSDYFKPVQYFGYYSIHSVCIPKFFVTKHDPAWKFSLTINIFNFLAFTFVASAYTVIYMETRQTEKNAGRDDQSDKTNWVLQKKILRLIVTDFCCWMPICIMAFSKLGGAAIGGTAYAVAAIVLLPINSALNPILYSDLPDVLQRLCCSKSRKNKTGESTKSSESRTKNTEL